MQNSHDFFTYWRKKSTKAKHQTFKIILPCPLPFSLPAAHSSSQRNTLARRALRWKTLEMYRLKLYKLLNYYGDFKRKQVRILLVSCKEPNQYTVTLILLRGTPGLEGGHLLSSAFKPSLKPGVAVITGTLSAAQIRACSLGGAAPFSPKSEVLFVY